jgi:hypothetical protein
MFRQTKPAEYWKKKGNDFVNMGKFINAIEMFAICFRLRVKSNVLQGTADAFDHLHQTLKEKSRGTIGLSQICESKHMMLSLKMYPSSKTSKNDLKRLYTGVVWLSIACSVLMKHLRFFESLKQSSQEVLLVSTN